MKVERPRNQQGKIMDEEDLQHIAPAGNVRELTKMRKLGINLTKMCLSADKQFYFTFSLLRP